MLNDEEYERVMTIVQEICKAAPLVVQELLSSAQNVSRSGIAAALANIHSYLPNLFHSEDAPRAKWRWLRDAKLFLKVNR